MADASEEIRFSASSRALGEEDAIDLTSVGVDIGSATSHIIFSRLHLERVDSRYVTTKREVIRESEILLTPYIDNSRIDGEALGRFIDKQYDEAGIERDDVDTGALILTGVALLRENARSIGELFASEAGKFVAVSAGDNLEATMAAHGSGAAQISEKDNKTVLNVDIGGGTTKLALCVEGRVRELAAFDVGARLVVVDENDNVIRLEEPGMNIAKSIGLKFEMGVKASVEDRRKMAAYMADQLMEIISLKEPLSKEALILLRTPNITSTKIDTYTFSGGVSEYIYAREKKVYGDLGLYLGEEIKKRLDNIGWDVVSPEAGIRATVIGASQYTVQVSGSTIYIQPMEAVPVRNVPVIMPNIIMGETISSAHVKSAVEASLRRFDLEYSDHPIGLALKWEGSATFGRINDFCQGIYEGMKANLDKGNPLVLVYDGDVGGLLGIHFKHEMHIASPLISIDGIELKEFDYIDIGNIIPTSGAVPVVIKSLVFPATAKK